MNKATPGEGLTHLGLGHWNRQSMHRRKATWLLTLYGTLWFNFIFRNTGQCHNIHLLFDLKIFPHLPQVPIRLSQSPSVVGGC